MKRISFNPRFVNKAGNDLIAGKIHTIRNNYDWWKRFEGKEVALFTWEGKPYRSKQKVFCVKKLGIQKIAYKQGEIINGVKLLPMFFINKKSVSRNLLANNDGFDNQNDFVDWFWDYPSGDMAVLHFTDFRY